MLEIYADQFVTTTKNLLRGVLQKASETGKISNRRGKCLELTVVDIFFINRDGYQ